MSTLVPHWLAQATPPVTQTPGTPPAPVTKEAGFDTYLQRLDLGKTFSETTWTSWGILLLAILAGLTLGKVAQTTLRGIGDRLLARGWTTRGSIFRHAAGPANLALITAGLGVGLSFVALSEPLMVFAARLLALLYIIALGWFLWNAIELIDILLTRITARTESKLDDMIVPLIRKALRIFLLVVFVLFTAENVFDADITAWLAGLGIAGLAVSLAAQDSIKNFFGSVAIFLDRPFGVGDRISFAGFDGTVEEIGFRSTRLRTLTGHLVTIPNSKIVDSSVENIARRPHIRRLVDLSLTYDTPPEKVQRAVEIVRSVLAGPDIASAFDLVKFPPRVAFDEFNADNLNLRVIYWFYPADYWQYLDHAQRFNLSLMRGFAAEGIEFAFPTRTLYLAGDANRQMSLRLIDGSGDGQQSDVAGGAGAPAHPAANA